MGSGSHIREIEWSTTELCSLPARSTALSSGARCSIRPWCGAASARIVGAKPRHWGRIDHSIRVGTPR